jgi:Glycosyltransferase family 87
VAEEFVKPLRRSFEILCLVSLLVGLIVWARLTYINIIASSDFYADYVAAKSLRAKVPLYPGSMRNVIVGETVIEGVLNFHPPFNAILFLPLSYLSYPTAFILWNLLNLFLYALLIYIVLRKFDLLQRDIVFRSFCLFLWYPFLCHILLGQSSIVLSVLIVGGYFLVRSGREATGAIFLACATLIKMFPGFLVLYFLILRKWYGAVVMMVTVVAGLLLTCAIVGSENFIPYFTQVIPRHADVWVTFPLNASLPGFLSFFFSDTLKDGEVYATALLNLGHLGRRISMIIPMVCSLPIAFQLFRKMKGKNDSESLFAFLLLTTLLVSPLTWGHMLVVTIFLFAILLRDYRKGISVPMYPAMLAAVLFWLPDWQITRGLYKWYSSSPVPWYACVLTKSNFLGLMILFTLFWRRINSDHAHFPRD